MPMMWDWVYLAVGAVLLFGGGEFLVRGSVSIADRYGISKLVVGLVIVGFGTSAPELLVSIQAALDGSPDISVGNVAGSNIANVLLIVGVAALIVPVSNNDPAIRRDLVVMVLASIVVTAIFFTGEIGRLTGIALVAALALYLGVTYALEARRVKAANGDDGGAIAKSEFDEEQAQKPLSLLVAIGAALLGLALLVVGARLMVDGAVGIARGFGISEAVIGVTVVALGTSLPELATAIIAAWRKHAEVVLANVVGSNIFNLLSILGITAIIAPIGVSQRFAYFDGPLMTAIAAAMLIYLFAFRSIGRWTGALLLALYAGYIGMQAVA
ncbi:calcium/sodium antiporter [Aurantimonas aggregata]|uniref:Calcium/sodium antiporter n=1 Tax=Aurantimonas aggregata TaxID=2047720 RepID=A0A6L9MCW1_9HYPH|nr:calcium/sodium antiporter [Aurantimonas aggregata]NDV85655.1 calcium/sodium antiporter [Aurantimonas aggregata]